MQRMRGFIVAVSAAAFGLGGGARPAHAQDDQALRAKYEIAIPQWLPAYEAALRSAPGSGASSPAAFGASFGDVYVGAGYQQKARSGDLDDGAVLVGFGLGNADRYLGLDVTITSYSTVRSGFGDHMAASFKLHRMLPGNTAVAAGVENGVHSAGTDGGRSFYGVVSRVIALTPNPARSFSAIELSAGVGNGRFRSPTAIAEDRQTVGAFGSVGLRVLPAASVIADWNGEDLTAALSLAPLPHVPIIITPSFTDLTGNAGGNRARFCLGVGGGVHVDF